jgi:hypothetical protein
LQNILPARRQKDVEAAELRVSLLRPALFDRQRGFGQQVARFRLRIARSDDLPTPAQPPCTVSACAFGSCPDNSAAALALDKVNANGAAGPSKTSATSLIAPRLREVLKNPRMVFLTDN